MQLAKDVAEFEEDDESDSADDEIEDTYQNDDEVNITGDEECIASDAQIVDDQEALEDLDAIVLEPLTVAQRKEGCLLLSKVG
ncbi:MAG: hypothetical protein ACREHG_06960, partial [Candidatus Saccharimonadales bacterium]